MAGSIAGGLRAAETNKAKNGEDFYKRIGSMGGKAKNPNKGFGSDRERARLAGTKGGYISRRPKKNES